MSRPVFFLIISLLVFTSLVIAYQRHTYTNLPFFPGEQKEVWLVEARIDYTANGASKISFALPEQDAHFQLYTEQSASQGFGYAIIDQNGQRRAEWTKRDAKGRQTLYYKAQFVAQQDNQHHHRASLAKTARPIFLEEPELTAAKQLLALAHAKSSDAASFTRQLITLLKHPSIDQNTALLLDSQPKKTYLLETLLNLAGIPAYTVYALNLEDARRRQPLTTLLEVYVGSSWLIFDTETGQEGYNKNLLIWHHGDGSLIDIIGGYNATVSFSMIRQTVPAEQLAEMQTNASLFNSISIQRLPIEEQSMFKLLFLLPIGALVVVFMRLLVGLKTSGTFMPILIALAFLHTSLIPGLLSFTLIVALGLLLRGYLSKLNLLMVARIASLIVLVVFIISFMSFLSYKLGLQNSITTTFFPMIIIAWTIERMSILWEEEGPSEVLKQGFGSLFVAVIAYLIMTQPVISHLSFNFPELNLIVLAFILLMGQYTGYRLSELRRFRDILKVMHHAD